MAPTSRPRARPSSAGDTAGSRGGDPNNEPGEGGEAVYTLDPPLGSLDLGSKGSGRDPSTSYYPSGCGVGDDNENDQNPYDPDHLWTCRSFPAERNRGRANFVFADGHAGAMTRAEVDDFAGNGVSDNGYWNGLGNPNRR